MIRPRTTRQRRIPYATTGGFPLCKRENPGNALHLRRQRDPAACLLHERHVHATVRELERGGDVVADLDRERLGEDAFVPERRQVQLERLRLEAERLGLVLDARPVEV